MKKSWKAVKGEEQICLPGLSPAARDKKYSTGSLSTELPSAVCKPVGEPDTCLFLPAGEGRQGEGGLRTRGCCICAARLHDNQRRIYGSQDQAVRLNGSLSSGDGACKDELPRITVITVVYNGGKFLEKTIQSVISQSYKNLEYIIIDGGSTDNSLEIIRRYEHAVDYWVSEKDNGIYDAMNKGIKLATGKWINFMNAGDYFFAQNTIEKVFQHPVVGDIIYGTTMYRYDSAYVKIRRPKQVLDFAQGLPFCHQSSFVRTSLHKVNVFSEYYKVHADFDLFAGFSRNGKVFALKELVISSVNCNGVSSVNGFRRLRELCTIAAKYNKKVTVVKFAIIFVLREFMKNILPLYFTRKIQVSK